MPAKKLNEITAEDIAAFATPHDQLEAFAPLIRDLIETEYNWFMEKCPFRLKKQMFDADVWTHKSKHPFPAHVVMGATEVALVLAGLKPCMVYADERVEELGSLWLEQVIQPWIKKHADALAPLKLTAVPTCKDAKTALTKREWMEKDGTKKEAEVHFGNGQAMVYRTNHPLAMHCQKVFTTPNRAATQEELQKAFGYPAAAGDTDIHYRILPGEVNALLNIKNEIFLDGNAIGQHFKFSKKDPAAIYAVGQHFKNCRLALRELQIPIGMDLPESMTPQSIGILYMSLADGNMDTVMSLMLDHGAMNVRENHDMKLAFQFMQSMEPKWADMVAKWTA